MFLTCCIVLHYLFKTTLGTNPVGRPSRNGTNICFNDAATNTSVVCYDAGYASNILYNGYTIIIITNVTWTYGHTYYVTMDSGFASGSVFCRKSMKTSDDIFIIICVN